MTRLIARFACVLLLLPVWGGIGLAHAGGELQGVSLLEAPSHTRVEFTLSRQPEYRVFVLDNPHRLVLDFTGAELQSGFAPGPVTGVVGNVRTGRPEPHQLRVVLDLAENVRPRSYLVPPGQGQGHRLVVELHPTDSAATDTATVRTIQDVMPEGQRDVVIAVDAGHGGRDPGARGANGSWEKNITLAISQELARQIDAEPGMRAVLIRTGDYFIPLQERYRRAREAQADLFVSIHADAFNRPTAAGSSVYVLSQRGASSEAARWLASSENAADLVGGVKLDDKDNTLAAVLLDLSQSATMRASEDAANQVLAALKRVGKTHKPQVERANFVVLRSPDVPSMLVETAFISNPDEERKLNDPGHQRALSAAVVDGIRGFFTQQPPPGTLLAARQGVPSTREYVVGRGDTLSSIAMRHNVSVAQLRSANSRRGDVVRVGERLRIPAPMTAGGGSGSTVAARGAQN
jgi:N-acetylmuramoyl-L-alanine amidase